MSSEASIKPPINNAFPIEARQLLSSKPKKESQASPLLEVFEKKIGGLLLETKESKWTLVSVDESAQRAGGTAFQLKAILKDEQGNHLPVRIKQSNRINEARVNHFLQKENDSLLPHVAKFLGACDLQGEQIRESTLEDRTNNAKAKIFVILEDLAVNTEDTKISRVNDFKFYAKAKALRSKEECKAHNQNYVSITLTKIQWFVMRLFAGFSMVISAPTSQAKYPGRLVFKYFHKCGQAATTKGELRKQLIERSSRGFMQSF